MGTGHYCGRPQGAFEAVEEGQEEEEGQVRNAEAYSAAQTAPGKEKLMYCCPECKGTNVHVAVWIDVNTEKPVGAEGPVDPWCNDCGEYVKRLQEISPDEWIRRQGGELAAAFEEAAGAAAEVERGSE